MKNFQITDEKKSIIRNVIKTALSDSSFKARLIKNPVAAINELEPTSGINEEKREIVISDQTDTNKIFINLSLLSLEMWGGDFEDIELTEEELEMVAGGSCSVLSCNSRPQ